MTTCTHTITTNPFTNGDTAGHASGARASVGIGLRKALFGIALVSFLGGCTTTGTSLDNTSLSSDPNAPQARVAQDFPIPAGSQIVTDQTLVLGSGSNWTGRLSLSLSIGEQDAFVYFRDQGKAYGWLVVSGSYGPTSILTLSKADRSATVLINEGNRITGTKVTITVSPLAVKPK